MTAALGGAVVRAMTCSASGRLAAPWSRRAYSLMCACFFFPESFVVALVAASVLGAASAVGAASALGALGASLVAGAAAAGPRRLNAHVGRGASGGPGGAGRDVRSRIPIRLALARPSGCCVLAPGCATLPYRRPPGSRRHDPRRSAETGRMAGSDGSKPAPQPVSRSARGLRLRAHALLGAFGARAGR